MTVSEWDTDSLFLWELTLCIIFPSIPQENLKSVLQGRRDKEFLKLYLEALVHLCSNPSSQSQAVSHKLLGSAAACVEVLLSMVETDSPGPELLFQSLCVISLLFVLG